MSSKISASQIHISDSLQMLTGNSPAHRTKRREISPKAQGIGAPCTSALARSLETRYLAGKFLIFTPPAAQLPTSFPLGKQTQLVPHLPNTLHFAPNSWNTTPNTQRKGCECYLRARPLVEYFNPVPQRISSAETPSSRQYRRIDGVSHELPHQHFIFRQ